MYHVAAKGGRHLQRRAPLRRGRSAPACALRARARRLRARAGRRGAGGGAGLWRGRDGYAAGGLHQRQPQRGAGAV